MAQLTEKENFLMCIRGEQPEWIPHITMDPGVKGPTGEASVKFLRKHYDPDGDHKDIFGVQYITSKEAAGGMLPRTWDFLLDDITKWHDVIKAPDISGFDWEQIAKKDLASSNLDRANQAASYSAGGTGFFQHLMAFMGFTEGLCALSEEPEECEALFDYIADFYCEVVEKTIDLYKPDVFNLTDDTAAWNNPFVSKEMMQRFFIPRYKRLADYAHERDIPVAIHNCGKCEIFLDDLVNVVGISHWNPAQNCNDLEAIKKKFGNRLVMCGCINSSSTFEALDLTEDKIREIVWDVANKYAVGGGFNFQVHFIMVDPTDQYAIWRKETVNRVMDEVGHEFYKK